MLQVGFLTRDIQRLSQMCHGYCPMNIKIPSFRCLFTTKNIKLVSMSLIQGFKYYIKTVIFCIGNNLECSPLNVKKVFSLFYVLFMHPKWHCYTNDFCSELHIPQTQYTFQYITIQDIICREKNTEQLTPYLKPDNVLKTFQYTLTLRYARTSICFVFVKQ